MRGLEPAPALRGPPGSPRASCSSLPSATRLSSRASALSPPLWGLPLLRAPLTPTAAGVWALLLRLGRFWKQEPPGLVVGATDSHPQTSSALVKQPLLSVQSVNCSGLLCSAPRSSPALSSLKESMELLPHHPWLGAGFSSPLCPERRGCRTAHPPRPALLPGPALTLPLPAPLPPGHPPAVLSGLRVHLPGGRSRGWDTTAPA